ncbi:MAG: hypothetical protein ACKVT1_21085 [Dehalococcoidia bacterium]
MVEDKKDVGAYIPWKTLLTATEVLEQGLPQRLDPSVFPAFSGSIKSWTMSAFRFLGFTDSVGNVQPRLKAWVNEPANRPALMKEVLLEKYPKVIALAAENGTVNQMKAAMGELGVSGTTLQKAMAFFIKASEFAQVPLPNAWKQAKLSMGTTTRKPKPTVEKPDDGTGKNRDGESSGTTTKQIALDSGGTVTLTIAANPWTTSTSDRDWLFQLVDQLNAYESQHGDGDDEDDDGDDGA